MRIKRMLLILLGFISTMTIAKADVTLQYCLEKAQENYPLINKYDLINSTESIELSDINKGWLPKIGVYAQATIQNVVPSFPSSLSNMMQQMGGQLSGLDKFQYKVGIDMNQTIWDGGVSKSQREIARQKSELTKASLNVDMYSIRQRVESLYFGILLLESQIEQSESAMQVYHANLTRLNSMVKNGVAMQADADMVEAQMLSLSQQIAQAKSALKGYKDMLGIFIGKDISNDKLVLPSAELPSEYTLDRPELKLFNSRMALNESQRSLINSTLMPKIGLFAQTYYGYPGIDYFKAMMNHKLSFNVIAGVKVSWNIDAFYGKKNSLNKIDIANKEIEVEKETFLFNTNLQATSQLEDIKGIEEIMKEDDRIVELRGNVRKAAESQLKNGVIDATSLIMKINDETQAKLTSTYHDIKKIQYICNLKNTINR